MKRIAVVTSGILPVPAVLGGAVENLMDFYLKENDKVKRYDMTVYSIYHPKVHNLADTGTHYKYYHTKSVLYRIRCFLYRRLHSSDFYDGHIDFFLHEVIQSIKGKEYDYIIVENRPGYVLPLSKVTNAKIILHLHNDFLNNNTPNAKAILDVSSGVVAVSHYIEGCIKTIQTSAKIQVVHNGINTDIFKPKDAIGLRAQLGFIQEDFVLVYSGRLVPEKGVKELIKAMLLMKEIPQIKLLIVGGNFYGNVTLSSPYIQELQHLAMEISDRIHFTGFIQYSEVALYLNACDVAVLPSIWAEPLGMTMIESMAVGLPVVSTRSGGIPELLSKDCCIFVETGDGLPERLAKAIQTIYNNPELRKRMSSAAIKRRHLVSHRIYVEKFFDAIECF